MRAVYEEEEGDDKEQRTYRVCAEYALSGGPLSIYFPCRLGDESRESKPIKVLVLLEVSKGDDKKAIEKGGRLVDGDACPDLVCYGVEKRGLVCVLEVLDGVEILERTSGGYRVLRHAVARNQSLVEVNGGNGKSSSLSVGEGVATDGEVATKGDVNSCLAIFDSAASSISCGES